jgi:hypothetical protein
MRHSIFFLSLLAGVAGFSLNAAANDSLPLKRVVISTSGLALYERQGTVTGNQSIDLPVRLDRVDDILKSLVVLDSKGTLGGVSLPGREPLSQAFRDLPFTEGDLTDLTNLLNALRGSNVKIGAIEGRLMNVTPENESTKDGGIITRRRVAVSTSSGVKTALIETADSIQFTDKDVQAQIDRALAAMFTNRIKDQRNVTISLRGDGARSIGLAYIEEAPLWKSGYRLVLPKDDNSKALLQGWAVLENTTGQDWDNVNVTLTSGAPVTFKQSLYESYYVDRPDLPVKFMDKIIPRADRGTVADKDMAREMGASASMESARSVDSEESKMSPAMISKSAMHMEESAMVANAPPMPMADYAAPQIAGAVGASAGETATHMTFAFPAPISLKSGDTLMIPFSAQDLPATQLYVYQPDTNAAHPLAAVELTNDTESGLPPGILTLYDASGVGMLHVGDAEMPMTPKDEKRFITYALDTKTSIESTPMEDRTLGVIKISKGSITQKSMLRATTTYDIKAPISEDRLIVIEHPRRTDWELVKPEGIEGAVETTSSHYRVRVKVAAGKTANIKITQQKTEDEYIALVGMNPLDMDARIAAAGKDLPPALTKALNQIRKMQGEIFDLQQKVNDIENRRQAIYNDQERLRENLKTVSTNTPIGKRYLDTMNTQEDQLNQMTASQTDLNAKIAAAVQALNDYVGGLNL